MTIRVRTAVASLCVLLALSVALPAEAQAPQVPASPGASAATCTDLSGRVAVPCPNDDGSLPPEKQPSKAAAKTTHRDGAPTSTMPKGGGSSPEQAQAKTAAPAPASDLPAKTQTDAAPPRPSWFRTTPFQLVYSPPSLRNLPRNLAIDQRNFWTSPVRVRPRDFLFLAPFAGATAAFIAKDASLERDLPTSATLIKRSKDFGTYGAAAFAGAVGGAFVLGKLQQNDHLAETGLLSGEAAANTFALTFLMKSASGRQRPLEGNQQGDFRAGGDSFPSEHSAAAWSIATVIAHEYPGPLSQLLAYGAASAMTASRVLGRRHFASDALVGSALGWFVGNQVYRAHHDRGADDAQYGTFVPAPREERGADAANMASSYVPLDSWVYAAFDRLIALGYVKSGFAGIRPWTRMECARLLEEAAQNFGADDADDDEAMYSALTSEFATEGRRSDGERNLGATLESLYARFTGISGTPLRDSYHFGQTIFNDYGRRYAEGVNLANGFSAHAEAGPLEVYARGEFQHAPAVPALPLAAREAASIPDHELLSPAIPQNVTNRFVPIEAYAGLQLSNWQLSFGWQSLWWGPGAGGPMMFSDNAESFPMLRATRVSPFALPGWGRFLGPIRTEWFIGQLQGHQRLFRQDVGFIGQFGRSLDTQPFIHGERISFKPTENFEFGFSRTALFAGQGVPFNAHTLFKSYFSNSNGAPGSAADEGDQRSSFDFTYRLPKLRNWLTWYADGFTDDEYSPVAYADRSAWRSGLYMPRVPFVPKLDLRVEGVYTDLPIGGAVSRGFFYYNGRYVNGYTNRGELIGSWIGRQGQGAQAWSTYHLNARNFVQASFRHQKVSSQFITGGGTLTDASVKSDYWLRPYVSLSALLQYEKWRFPVLAPAAESNVVGSFQVTFWPGHRSER